MNKSPDYYQNHTENEYEESHGKRLDFLISDLNLNNIQNKKICDFGCGYGQILNRLIDLNLNNIYYGIDNTDYDFKYKFNFIKHDLALPINELESEIDICFCFEVIEHVGDPYQLLCNIKKVLKINGELYLSIPHINCKHAVIYPSLFYPESNFEVFLQQMAFEVIDKRYHDKCFSQNVYKLKNLEWKYSKNFFHYGKTNEDYYGHDDKRINLPLIDLINS